MIAAVDPRRRRPRHRFTVVALSLLTAAMAGSCSDTFSFGDPSGSEFLDAGEALIQGEIADQIGLGPLEAVCNGRNLAADDSFSCTATASEAGPIEFTGTVNAAGDGVNVVSTNLILAAQVEQVEAFAASLLEEQTAQPFEAANFECGDTSLIVTVGAEIDCLVTDPADGTVYQAPVTIENLEDLSITVNIGDPVG